MNWSTDQILEVLDAGCDAFTFPMLDNGYVYLAATRLSLFRSSSDWALTIEVFGYSPRRGLPDTHIYTFGSLLRNRQTPEDYVSQEAYGRYLANNPNNESRFIEPVEGGDWLDGEEVAAKAERILVRGELLPLPHRDQDRDAGISLESGERIRVFELCRWLAVTHRAEVLATTEELRVNVPDESELILQLNEWNHPDVVDDDSRPSGSETFQLLAGALVTGDPSHYRPTLPPNTHWRNWPEGGTL
jgi:hypothetical protein